MVEDLDNDTAYIMRVSAVNQFGQGEAKESSEVSTGTPYVEPSVTSPPRLVDVKASFHFFSNLRISIWRQNNGFQARGCKLEWDAVKEDGGSPIYGFVRGPERIVRVL